MGKGDAKSKKGKRWRGSFGISRPSKVKSTFKVGAKVAEAVGAEVAAEVSEKPKVAKKKA